MMAKRRKGLSDRHKKILEVLEKYQVELGYPPSIREIGKEANISSTSVVNYYLSQLEEDGYIERADKISRGVRLVKRADGDLLENSIQDFIAVPVIGRIVASAPAPVPASDFNYFDSESVVNVARGMLGSEKPEELYALQVQGDSMIDAMVNDGDIVIMRRVAQAQNGEMVAVWLTDKDETTLKYFFKEGKQVRLQPANPTMAPIIIKDLNSIEVQGKVIMVIRKVNFSS
ncbi:MAG: repressor LexA [Anaerolineales bacterium]|nr:repressor LexA [Anaerolineales bacterium]